MRKAVANESLGTDHPHTYADFVQSPRYPEVIRTPANTAETASRDAVLQPHSSAPRTQNAAEYSRKTVAESDATQSQVLATKARAWLAALLLSLAFWAAFLGSLWAAGAFAKCRTHRCWAKVSHRRHVNYAWRWIKAHPMPYCTWGPESGPGDPWKRSRYRVVNRSSTAAGKYQLLDRSAHAVGIPNYKGIHDAAKASPLAQERAARRLLAIQGIHAWVNC